ncbi:MAG: DNA primase [Calditrichota bacterium]
MPGYFDDSFIQQVREAVDIVEVISGHVTLKQRRPGDWWAPCPFHGEKTASFHVLVDRGMFHCFGCGRGGNVISFLMEMEGLSFVEAIKSLAERAGLEIPQRFSNAEAGRTATDRDRIFQANLLAAGWFHERLTASRRTPEAGRALEYLQSRGLSLDLIKRFQIGWAESGWDGLVKWSQQRGVAGSTLTSAGLALRRKDESGFIDRFRARVMFPIHNLSGKPVAFGGRRIDGITPDQDLAKYVNTNDTAVFRKGDQLYGLNIARDSIRRLGYAYLVEGYTDLLALNRAGADNTVASLGTALTKNQSGLLSRFTGRVHIVYDNDQAGRDASLRAAGVLTQAGLEVRIVKLPEGQDPDSLLRSAGPGAVSETLNQHQSLVQFHLEVSGALQTITMDAKIQAARSILENIALTSDPVRRELLLGELSASLDLRREALDQVLAQLKTQPSEAVAIITDKVELKFSPECIPERDLLRALLTQPDLGPDAIAAYSVEKIRHPALREIYRCFEQAAIKGKVVEAQALSDRFDDPALRAFIADAALTGRDYTDSDAGEWLKGCLNQLKKRDLRDRCKELENLISKASKTGQPVRDYFKELVEISHQLDTL